MLHEPYSLFEFPYRELLTTLLASPVERNARTGREVFTLRGGAAFKLDLRAGWLPLSGLRQLHPGTAAAEVAWFLSGERSTAWLKRHCAIWEKFVEEGTDIVGAAYGYRWRRHFARDQVALALATLAVDPSDRRVYVSAWDPGRDGLGEPSKNVPCPLGFTLSMTQSPGGLTGHYELHSTLTIRSSDVFVGLPYDVMGHAILMDVLRASLPQTVTLGTMTVALGHPHLYRVHEQLASEALAAEPAGAMTLSKVPMLGSWPLAAVEADPDGFVEAYRKRTSETEWPAYRCRPEVVS